MSGSCVRIFDGTLVYGIRVSRLPQSLQASGVRASWAKILYRLSLVPNFFFKLPTFPSHQHTHKQMLAQLLVTRPSSRSGVLELSSSLSLKDSSPPLPADRICRWESCISNVGRLILHLTLSSVIIATGVVWCRLINLIIASDQAQRSTRCRPADCEWARGLRRAASINFCYWPGN